MCRAGAHRKLKREEEQNLSFLCSIQIVKTGYQVGKGGGEAEGVGQKTGDLGGGQ